ncbi:MAG: CHAP domain-containing protein [Cystobacter sp.]
MVGVLGAGALAASAAGATPSTPYGTLTRVIQGRFVAERAVSLVGGPSLAKYKVPNDCSGLVRVAYHSVGVELLSQGALPGENAVGAIYRRAKKAGAVHQGTPRPGDLIFFRETYDRNRDGLRNDGLTHIGIVERVASDGTVTFVHRVNRGVRRARMNPKYPTLRKRQGRVFNETLRRAGGNEPARSTGELFVAYASSSRM